jgi:hypothetical protein
MLVTGTVEGTDKPNMSPKALDTQTWVGLAIPDHAVTFSSGLRWAERACRVERGGVWGYGFSDQTLANPSPDIWPEGTAQFALAWRLQKELAKSDAILGQLNRMQRMFAIERPSQKGALPGAMFEHVITGYKTIDYWHYAHSAATAWYILSSRHYDIFTGRFLESE